MTWTRIFLRGGRGFPGGLSTGCVVMNIFISADMEGVTGVTSFDEVTRNAEDYSRFRKIMTEEVNAAISGALEVTSGNILVNDSHGSMRNILIEDLHPAADLVAGSVKDHSMMEGLKEEFDAVFCLGYHAMSGTAEAILAHTISTGVASIKVNEREVGELGINGYYAGSMDVPVVMVSWDDKLTHEANSLLDGVETAVVKEAFSVGAALHKPIEESREIIREKARAAVEGIENFEPLVPEDKGKITVSFKSLESVETVKRFPFVDRLDGYTVQIKYSDYGTGFENLMAMLKAT